MTRLTIISVLFFSILSAGTTTAQSGKKPEYGKFLVQRNTDSLTAAMEFGEVEQVPVFPKCEEFTSNEERKTCMAKGITNFVNRKFNTNLLQKLEGFGWIDVKFQIDTSGNVVNIEAESNHEKLAQEAARVVARLPKMQPAKQAGEVVPVAYFLPITFRVGPSRQN